VSEAVALRTFDSRHIVVNYIGCSQVLDNLATTYSTEYATAQVKNFTTDGGDVSGWTKSAGKGAGNVAYVAFYNAGHMVCGQCCGTLESSR
jgi:cathepsin A (carboxypeptidase C)